MRVLVTGGSGFIGSHLVEALLERGHQVRVFDRRVPRSKGVEWIDGDLRWIGDCDRATRNTDVVFHLAARISVDESLEYVMEYFTDNFLTTMQILHASLKNGVRKFLHTSSCEVYGDTYNGKADEMHPCNPTSAYAASKYAAERTVLAFSRTYDFPVVILRPFNVFGERQKPFVAGAVIPSFIILALRSKDLVIHGDGSQVRDYTYVKDVAEAHVVAMDKCSAKATIVNVASGIGRTINEIAENVIRLSESSSKPKHIADPRGGAQLNVSIGDTREINSLGWYPKWDFEDALMRSVEWYKSQLSEFSIPEK